VDSKNIKNYGLTKAETPKEYWESGLMLGVGAGSGIFKGLRSGRALLSSTKAYKIPFKNFLETPLRRRATIILKTPKDKILYHVDKPTGTYMLLGGNIKVGESPIKGAKRELFEETGLKGLNLKFKEKIYTSEHEHFVFEDVVDKSISKSLKPQASEVSGFKWFKPPKYTGASMLQPLGRKSSYLNIFTERIVRAEDLFVGSKNIYPELKLLRKLLFEKDILYFLKKELVLDFGKRKY